MFFEFFKEHQLTTIKFNRWKNLQKLFFLCLTCFKQVFRILLGWFRQWFNIFTIFNLSLLTEICAFNLSLENVVKKIFHNMWFINFFLFLWTNEINHAFNCVKEKVRFSSIIQEFNCMLSVNTYVKKHTWESNTTSDTDFIENFLFPHLYKEIINSKREFGILKNILQYIQNRRIFLYSIFKKWFMQFVQISRNYVRNINASHIFKLKVVPWWIVREAEEMEKFVVRRVEIRITHFYTSFNSSRREYGNAFFFFSQEELQARKI